MNLYHFTTEEAARTIIDSRRFESKENGGVYVSDSRTGHATSYGDHVVIFDDSGIHLKDEWMSDEFHSAEDDTTEVHYRIPASYLNTRWPVLNARAEPAEYVYDLRRFQATLDSLEGRQIARAIGLTHNPANTGSPADRYLRDIANAFGEAVDYQRLQPGTDHADNGEYRQDVLTEIVQGETPKNGSREQLEIFTELVLWSDCREAIEDLCDSMTRHDRHAHPPAKPHTAVEVAQAALDAGLYHVGQMVCGYLAGKLDEVDNPDEAGD